MKKLEISLFVVICLCVAVDLYQGHDATGWLMAAIIQSKYLIGMKHE